MHPFQYVSPKTISEVVSTLSEYGERARCLAGGTDVLVQTRTGRYNLDAIVDVKSVPELMSFTLDSSGLSFGAAVPCYQLYEDRKVSSAYPGIIDSASIIGGIQIQSRASLGGNLCNASPSADGIPALIVHHAVARVAGPSGNRDILVEDFCTGPGTTILNSNEILVSLHLPSPSENFGAAYQRFIPRNEMDIAVAGAGSSVEIDPGSDRIISARIALAAVGPKPIFATTASKSLEGQLITDNLLEEAGKLAASEASPIDDMRGTAKHRSQLVKVLVQRTLAKAINRAREQ